MTSLKLISLTTGAIPHGHHVARCGQTQGEHWQSQPFDQDSEHEAGLTVVNVTGLVTKGGLSTLASELARVVAHACSSAIVVRFDLAAFAIVDDELSAWLDTEATRGLTGFPVALVVPLRQLSVFRGHAMRIAYRGMLRRVVTDFEYGLGWAS